MTNTTSSPDSLTVYLSGDAWQGDANATITVNGTPVGGVLDVSAVNAAGATQAFTFTGNFGAAPQVGLSFINSNYAGNPQQQRNLYLDGFSYDGVPQLSYKAALRYDQTLSYTLTSVAAPAERAADFVNSVGVDVHLSYPNTPEGNVQTVAASMAYLGLNHMSAGVPNAQTLAPMQTLAALGVKFAVIMPSASSDSLLLQQLAAVDALAPAIAAIQGPNEVNISSDFSWDGQTGVAAEHAYEAAMFADVKADPNLKGVPVYGLTIAGAGADAYTAFGSIAATETDGNMHVYFPAGTPPNPTIQYVQGITAISSPGVPLVITETNYTTEPLVTGFVSDTVQARYDLDLLMDAAKDGIAATYFYELLDQQPDPADTATYEDHFGLFNNDGTPKQAATAIHNLTSILADTGAGAATFATAPLGYSVTGLPASGNTLLLQKSDGSYDLVVWAEPEIWSTSTGFIAVPPTPVQVTLGSQFAGVSVFDPLSGTAAVAQYANTASLQVTLTDHPLVIQLTPAASPVVTPPVSTSQAASSGQGSSAPPVATTTVPASSFQPVVLGQGPDTLALFVSEDAFQGNAQFTIAINGTQVGGIQTATAAHFVGAPQEFDVLGNFAAGPYQASITFLNDLYVAGAGGDRNLYVNSATLDGASVAGSALTLDNDGTQSFNFGGAVAAAPVAAAVAKPTVLGHGPDTLALFLSEDAFQGDAQFTVAINGTQVGGVQTVTASHAAGAAQEFDVLGNFGGGPYEASVTFLNGLSAAGSGGGRNLYVNDASFHGTLVAGSALILGNNGTQSFDFSGAPITPVSVGQGPDKLALFMAEDAFRGDAQFTVTVDGTQVGGTQTMSPAAAHVAAAFQEFDVLGSFSSGQHQVTINFLNDLYQPGVGDRNLYLNGASFDGAVVPGTALTLDNNGAQSFDFSGAPITLTVLGQGPDTLALFMSEDAFQGDAQFTVAVDGKQVGGVQTVNPAASHSTKGMQEFDVLSSFAAGAHQASITFLNDAYAPGVGDRNLYLDSVTANGAAVAGSSAALMYDRTQSFSFTVPTSH